MLYYWRESLMCPFEMRVQFNNLSCLLCVGSPFTGIPCSLSWPCCLRSVNSPRWALTASPRQALTWTLRTLSVIRRRRANPSSVRTLNSTTWWDTAACQGYKLLDFWLCFFPSFFCFFLLFFSLNHFGERGFFPCSALLWPINHPKYLNYFNSQLHI